MRWNYIISDIEKADNIETIKAIVDTVLKDIGITFHGDSWGEEAVWLRSRRPGVAKVLEAAERRRCEIRYQQKKDMEASEEILASLEDETELSYDPATCITAGELREIGAEIPETIPNCAWIDRAFMKMSCGDVTMGDEEGSMFVEIVADFRDVFRWINATVVKGGQDG